MEGVLAMGAPATPRALHRTANRGSSVEFCGPTNIAVGETVILLHPSLPLAGVPIAMERVRQQNDRTLADGCHQSDDVQPAPGRQSGGGGGDLQPWGDDEPLTAGPPPPKKRFRKKSKQPPRPAGLPAKAASRRREFCHFADAPSAHLC